VFGLSFGEFCVLIVVAIIVIGPKDMPRVLRKMGQFAGKIRRMAADVRSQSGIDEVLRTEGLTKEITEIRRLAQGDFAEISASVSREDPRDTYPRPPHSPDSGAAADVQVVREREYPREGADSYGALPDTSTVYSSTFPASTWASDPLYVLGDADAKLVAPAPPADAAPAATAASVVEAAPSPPPAEPERAPQTPGQAGTT
jgi:sec-independent protein translocase protein TatB